MATPSEELRLGPMVPAAPPGSEIPPEPADVGARALYVASRLLAGASIFFFLAFLFAYFYLRSLNQEHMWHPAHVKPDQGLGAAFIACVVLSVLGTFLADRRVNRPSSRSWLVLAAIALALGLAAIALQCIEYTVQHFGPTDGAYASVFCAWTAFYLIAVLGTMYWLQTQIATELRARRAPDASSADIEGPDRLIAPALDAALFYWALLGVLGVIMYVTLYIL
jgi:heme/copper-type cytochrome/quinol oxidase subunit 3